MTDTDRTEHPPENLAEASAAGPPARRPDTVVLVHGLWMTPRSWQGWVAHYEQQGLTVLAPGYPGFEIEVEGLRENPQLIADLTVPETLDHLASVIERSTRRRSSWATRSGARSPSSCSRGVSVPRAS